MSDDLVKRLRQDINETDTFGRRKNWTEQRSERRKAADRIEAQAAEIERLRAAGQKLNDYACHDDDCQIVTHGVWSDPIPCDCGYEDAWRAWAVLGETK